MKRSLLSLFLVVMGVAGYAQTGPGGVGNTLGVGQPRNIIWLDASTLALSDGNDILSWPDLSGNANNFSATGTFSPQFENTAPLNGLGYARFSKANNRIVKTALTDMPQSAYTVVLVYRTTDTGDGLVSYAASDAKPDEYLLRNSDALRTYIIDGAFDQSLIATNNNTFRSLMTSWENVDGVLDYYMNGAESGGSWRNITGFKIGQTIQSGGAMAIGNDQDLLDAAYDPADAFAGDIAEVIVYDRKLNAMQVRIVHNYIAAKYNVAVASVNYIGSAPGNGDYDLKLIGVGRLNGTTHNEGNSDGFILTGNTYSSTNTFAFAGHNSVANSAVATSLGAGVQQRWNRSWYVDFTANLTVDATFDLGEGIGGGSPVNKDNYVLLKLVGGVWTDQGVASANKFINGDRISFRVTQAAGDGAYTLGTLDAAGSPVAGINIRTWYSYQTGNWNNPDVWTLDGGVVPLLTNPGNQIPQPSDNVVITNGRTVTMNINNVTIAGMQVNGTLNIAATSGHNFNNIEGNGRIRVSGAGGNDNFPAGTTTLFADALNGGTVEYYGNANITLNQNRTFNNVELKFNSGAITATLMSNFVLNGELRVETGTFSFNDNVAAVSRTMSVTGNVTIESTGSMIVGTAGVVHEFNLQGDLNNNGGNLALTNYTVADYTTAVPANGGVNANFVSALQNQELICNGFSKFWRIKIDKGSDDTYKVRITANSTGNFNLLGFAAHNNDADVTPYGAQTNNLNALGLVRGTVEIGNNVVISTLNNTGNYCVYTPATLWVNGGSVTKPAGTAIVGYGKIKVSAGTLNAPINSGVTLRVNGTLEVEGGTVTLNQIRTSVLGSNNIGGYIQNGGSVIVNTGNQGVNEDYYTFSMTYPGNVFRMGGGTLTIRRSAQTADRGLVYINSDPQNVSVTGGSIILELSHNHANYAITSRAPFWNLTLRKTNNNTQTFKLRGGSSGDSPSTTTTLPAQPLVVLNSLNIENPTAGTNTILDAQGNDVILGKDFILSSAAVYTTGTNTTRFNGTANGILSLGGVARSFNNFYVEKTPTATTLDIQNGVASPAAAATINGTFSVITGTLTYGAFVISAKAGVVNTATVGASANTGKVILDGGVAQAISSNNGTFFNLELNNAAGVTLNTGTLNVARTLTMTAGVFNIGVNKLSLIGATAGISGSGFGITKMIQTAGNSSDGGLELYFGGVGTKTYPIGTNANAVVRYTPATATIQNFADDGYIKLNIEDKILQTTDLTAGANILSYNWRAAHSGFTTLPRVSYQFTYDNSDVDAGNEAVYVPGKVLAVNPYTRSTDGGIDDVNTTTNVITFNGGSTASAFPGTGFIVETANYTAGAPAFFTGTPKIYYTRQFDADGWNVDWRNTNFWTLGANGSFGKHDSRQAAAGDYPKAGDIAVIGWVPFGDPAGNNGFPHGIALNRTEDFAELVFTQMRNASNNPTARIYASNFQFRPTLVINNNGPGSVGQIGSNAIVSGEGSFWIRSTGGNLSDPNFAGVDLGFFNAQDSSYFIYETTLSAATYTNGPSAYPNLLMATDGWGNQDKSSTIDKDIVVRGDLELLGNVNLVLPTGSTGNIIVNRNLRFFRSNAKGNDSGGGGELRFGNTGTARTVTVLGNLFLGNGYDAIIRVLSPGTTPLTHTFSLYGNFVQNTTAGNGFKGGTSSTNDRIHLNILGSTSMTMSSTGGDGPQLYSVTINKGTSILTTATITSGITLTGPTNALPKALDLKNGLLILDNPATNINLTTGNGDFSIPSTAGLQVSQGQVNVSGTNTGILLDGLLKITGGIVNMDDAVNGGNNYIEYSASGIAQLEITSGGLVVGSQIRRGLTSTAGILKYVQSGGTVTVGKNAASQTNRGVFEIVNTGSRFSYTGGSLTIVQGVNSAFVPSILIETTNFNFPNTQILTIGSPASPSGNNIRNIGIKTSQVWGGLTIDNSSSNDPIVKLYTTPLTLSGPLTVNTGATFNAQGFDLTLRHNFTNNGIYLASGNKTIFSPIGNRTVSGNGTFDIYKMDKIATATLNMGTSLIVNNELRVLSGTIATASNFLVAKQNVVFDAVLNSTTGLGLVFEGTSKQILSRTENTTISTLSIVTIRNSSGVEIPDGQGYKFTINNQLRLESGVFDVGGNLLLITATGSITPVNPFSVGNMIRTNSSFSDSGVRKIFPAGFTTDFIFPVGQAHYTPITFNFGSPGRTTGTTSPTITIRTAEEPHPAVIEDAEAPDPEIVDVNNVLQYYYTIDAENVNPANFNVDAIMKYDPAYVAVTAPYTETNYITASILTNNNPTEAINKSSGVVNTASKTLTFTFSGVTSDQISGDYFAGIDTAIPDNVPVYQTIASGDINDPTIFNPQPPGVPTGAIVIVNAGHELDFNVNSVRLYKTIINAGSTLDIEGTYGHRLGTVSGTGTLKITSDTESAVMPAGFFEDFFGCGGGSLEFAGIGLYDIMGGITEVRNLTLSGGGQRLLSNNDLHVCNNLFINGPAMLNSNLRAIVIDNDFNLIAGSFSKGSGTRTLTIGHDLNVSGGTFLNASAGDRIVNRNLTVSGGTFNAGSGGTWTLRGNLILTGGTFNGGSGSVKFLMNNLAATQNIIGNFSGAAQIHRLEINGLGLFLNGNVDINNELLLTNGKITPDVGTTFRMNTSAVATPINGSPASFVNGRLYKILNGGGSFSFPVGKVNRWRYAKVNNTTTGPLTWYAEYFIGNADVLEPLVDNQLSSDAAIVHVSGGEYWKVGDNTNPLDVNAQVGLSWGLESDVSSNQSNRESLKVMVWNDAISLWDNYGGTNFLAGHSQSQGDFTTSTNISFSEQIITLGTTNLANPLPVELTQFTAVMTEFNTALLKWHTESETNNDRFEVERSQNGVDFEYLGQVKGAGTSNKAHDYMITDEQPLAGTSYYRLKQVDLDGTSSYSPIRSVTNNGERNTVKFSAYPNPVDLSRYNIVTFNKVVNVIIYNNLNRPVRQYQQIESFDATGLPNGIYIIRTHMGETFKLLVK